MRCFRCLPFCELWHLASCKTSAVFPCSPENCRGYPPQTEKISLTPLSCIPRKWSVVLATVLVHWPADRNPQFALKRRWQAFQAGNLRVCLTSWIPSYFGPNPGSVFKLSISIYNAYGKAGFVSCIESFQKKTSNFFIFFFCPVTHQGGLMFHLFRIAENKIIGNWIYNGIEPFPWGVLDLLRGCWKGCFVSSC